MNNIVTTTATSTSEPTMTSVALLEVINFYRKQEGKGSMRHSNLMVKIEDELDVLDLQQISYLDTQNRQQPCYLLDEDDCRQLLIRESKACRKAVVQKLRQAQPVAIPQRSLDDTLEGATRAAKSLLSLVDDLGLSDVSKQALAANVLYDCTGKEYLPLPKIERTLYSCQQLADAAGISQKKAGSITNKLGLKTDERYSVAILNKAKYSDKQVTQHKYTEKGREVFLKYVKQNLEVA